MSAKEKSIRDEQVKEALEFVIGEALKYDWSGSRVEDEVARILDELVEE